MGLGRLDVDKVYCIECKYFRMQAAVISCHHSNNDRGYRSPPSRAPITRKKEWLGLKEDPRKINKENDCSWFEEASFLRKLWSRRYHF